MNEREEKARALMKRHMSGCRKCATAEACKVGRALLALVELTRKKYEGEEPDGQEA